MVTLHTPKLALDIRELGESLALSPRIIRELVNEGALPRPVEIHGNRRWILNDIEAWLESRRDVEINTQAE